MVIVLGLGFTGVRLARRLLARGLEVGALARDPGRFRDLAAAGLKLTELPAGGAESSLAEFPENATLFYSIPPLPEPMETEMHSLVEKLAPRRVVYISSTGIYGAASAVDENTPAEPADERGRQRLEAERWISGGTWEALVLRAAAIYGPGRGIHMAVREGRMPRGGGSGIVSRIHVEDLAAIAEAGLFSAVQGTWPVADDAPCSSAEIAAWCAEVMGLERITPGPIREFPIAGRSVDGRKIRELLGVQLVYPDWKAGITASLAEEKTAG